MATRPDEGAVNTPISIRPGGEDDIPRLGELLQSCIDDMRRQGIEQWDHVYPNEEVLRADAIEKTLYVGTTPAHGIVGLFVLNEYQNPEYAEVEWTIRGTRIGVVHRVMVDPPHQRGGIARELMRAAEATAQRLGYDALRLDAFTLNPRALRLYQGLGYHDAGSVMLRKGVFRCFEKALARNPMLVRLKFGAAFWSRWRQDNPGVKIVLDGVRLDGMILTGIDFSDVSLRGASLHAANLMNADLRRADLTDANLREADLISTNLREAVLTGACLQEADLLGADLTGARYSAADLAGALHVEHV
jgi:GNAT superfamily N-acetyltransferase